MTDMTLAEARLFVHEHLAEGVQCPACGQRAKIYPRTIHATMARELIHIYRTQGTGWFHLPSVIGHNGGDVTKCRYWGLLQEDDARREDGGRAGHWHLTGLGVDFVKGRVSVAKHAHLYNGKLLGLTGDQVRITDCLGKKFNYAVLMGAPVPITGLEAA